MRARRDILHDGCFTHVFFRCHNQSFFFKPDKVKQRLLSLWAKYKKKYGVEIFEFIIMDNHAHLMVKAQNVQGLSGFMQVVNSQIAAFINHYFDKDSQVIRERFRSPLISNGKYLVNVMQYIWLNRFRQNHVTRPELDPYCSAAWRINPKLFSVFAKNKFDFECLSRLLDSYEQLPIGLGRKSESSYVLDMINAAISKIAGLSSTIFEHAHTIGDEREVSFRRAYLSAFRREQIPWSLPP